MVLLASTVYKDLPISLYKKYKRMCDCKYLEVHFGHLTATVHSNMCLEIPHSGPSDFIRYQFPPITSILFESFSLELSWKYLVSCAL